MAHVLVTDAQMRSTLAVIRSLGKHKISITAGEETRFATGFFSKYCTNHVVYPSPTEHKEDFINFIIDLVQHKKYDMLIPVANPCLLPIIENEKEISQYCKIALPPKEIFLKAYNKENTLKLAMDNHVACPKTFFIYSIDDLFLNKNNFQYPLVIKPKVSAGSRGFVICHSFIELLENYKHITKKFGEILIQEYIPNGGEFGVYTLFNKDSEPISVSVQKRIRTYPVKGGPSTLRETIKNDLSDEAIKTAFRLLRLLNWVGVAMVEFRTDARDGIPKLMEINPRFWGSLELSILSGVDFPYLLYQSMNNEVIETNLHYKAGVKCRWILPGDILWYLSSQDKIKNLPEFLRFDLPDDIISKDDPLPTLGFGLATLRYAFDRKMWNFVIRR